uniref:Reverse transcriptase zinc-binding domain-containing protein n=1 Tax=Fagus sylvatica TaxID=28930 RepID=A0A2N9FEZ3_FAGSY
MMWEAVLVPVSGWIYAMGFPLRAVFSLLFRIAQNKDALVAVFCWQNGVAHWDVRFTRSVHDWSWCLFRIFLVFFIQDRVLSFFLFYSGFPMEEHLEAKVPPRVAFFVWTTARERLTMDNLGKRHICIVEWC